MPTTVDLVKAHLGLAPTDSLDAESLDAATAAANDMIATLRPDVITDAATTGGAWPDRVTHAATLWAARLYRRRGSVEGLAGYQDLGGVPIIRIDPDIQAELELGPWQRAVIA
jgi:hypothetical protein